MNSTKEKIILTALDQFSQYGFKGTNLRDLAQACDLSKSALYKYFSSKEDIYNAVLDYMEEYYDQILHLHDPSFYIPASFEELKQISIQQVNYILEDNNLSKMRRLLTIGQFRDPRTASVATDYFVRLQHYYYKRVFEGMISNKVIRKTSPISLAVLYTSSIAMMVDVISREPSHRDEFYDNIDQLIDYIKNEFSYTEN